MNILLEEQFWVELGMNLNIKDTFEGIKEFKPLSNKEVKIYSCGPTVYNFVTIGNLRSFITSDIIKKSLRFIGFKVLDVMNITDVGHLTGDADNTEDKIEVSAKKQNKDIHEIINFYTDYFFSVIDKVNIKQSNVIARASEEVQTQIELIKILEKKGFVYQSETGVYFDISKFSDYKKYARQDINLQLIGARKEVHKDKTKKHPYDFRLWQTSYPNHLMQWDSPWGRGFPGWHIECSAIIYKYLGESIDIHTGGTDLIYPHHVNEIAQSVSAFSSKFVNFWIHNEMVLLNGVKMAKSLGNVYLIEDIEKRGINPLVLRYFYMSAHFSSLINFTFQM
jgi:cysteinyl-tRNA synthetase